MLGLLGSLLEDGNAGYNFENSCVAATTANLTATYANGAGGVNATLTNSGALAAFSVDGQTPSVGARILVKDQSTQTQNGIYVLTVAGSGSVAWVLTRASDYDIPSQINSGDVVPVSAGTQNIGSLWRQTATVAIIGTDNIVFAGFFLPSNYVAKAGDTMTGNLSAPKVAIGTTDFPAIDTIGEGLVTGASLDGVTQTTRTSRSRIGNAELNFVVNHNHSTTQPIDELNLQANSDSSTHVSVVNGQLIKRTRYGGRYQSGGTGSYYLAASDEVGIDDTGTISATSMPGKRTRSVTPDGSKTPVVFETVRNTGRISQKCLTLSCSNLTDAATVAVDLAASNNFNLNLTAAVGATRQLGIPTNPEAEQEGTITVRQDSSGSRALTYAWCYIFPQLIAPTLSILKGAMDLLAYKVLSYFTATATMTIATPCVVTQVGNGLVYGQRVAFSTTGALPTGVTANTGYYINPTSADTYNLATSLANLQAGTYVATSGSQSGVHTGTNLEIIIAMNANNGA